MPAGGKKGGGVPPKSLVDKCQEIVSASPSDLMKKMREVVEEIGKSGNINDLLDLLRHERNAAPLQGALAVVYTKTLYGIYSQDYDLSDEVIQCVANLVNHPEEKVGVMAIMTLALLLRSLDWSRIRPQIQVYARGFNPSVQMLPAYWEIQGAIAQ